MNDLISRQDAIDVLEERLKASGYSNVALVSELNRSIGYLMRLPSVQPERKTGHWVETGDEPYDEWECDVCGFTIDGSGCIDPEEYRDVYKFCPNCGADMRGEKNG